uniref:Putative conserved plasma membrane protein n=1 Tax=Anopheles darlingi TaxID=43151 RepID=A0A2M4CRY3_ANODA
MSTDDPWRYRSQADPSPDRHHHLSTNVRHRQRQRRQQQWWSSSSALQAMLLLAVFALTALLPSGACHPRSAQDEALYTDAFEGPTNRSSASSSSSSSYSRPTAALQSNRAAQRQQQQQQQQPQHMRPPPAVVTSATGRATSVRRAIRPYRVHHDRTGVVRTGRNTFGYTVTNPSLVGSTPGAAIRPHRSKSNVRQQGNQRVYENVQTGTIILPVGGRAFLEPDHNRTIPVSARQDGGGFRPRMATNGRKRPGRPQLQQQHGGSHHGTKQHFPAHGRRHGIQHQQKFTVIDGLCIKCPPEKTAIARKGLDGVLIEPPLLTTCRDRPISKDLYELETLFGPKLNFVLPHSNGVPFSFLAKVISKHTGAAVQTCEMRYTVVVKQCRRYKPKNRDLKAICNLGNIWGSRCTFHCRNGGYLSHPNSFVECSEDEIWEGEEPYCTFNDVSDDYAADASDGHTLSGTDCQLDIPPANGRFACDLKDTDNGDDAELTIPNGTACQVKCDEGHDIPEHLQPAAFFGCVDGQWNNTMRPFCYKSSTINVGGNNQRRRGYG